MSYEVFIVDSADVPHTNEDAVEREVLADCAQVTSVKLHSEQDFDPYADRADGIILWHHLQIGAGLIAKLRKTRLIVRNGVGFDNVDIVAAAKAGIAVANVPDYGTEEVADHAIALALALIRQIKPLMNDVANGNWDWKTSVQTRRLSSLNFAVVGCGRIGTATALRAKALGFRVRFYDPYLPSGYEKAIGVQRAESLQDLLPQADVLSIHVPLSEETRHLIGAKELALMQSSSYLVNTARGPVVSYDAVRDALAAGKLAGAGLDVLEAEPNGGEELSKFPNCIVTPHTAFYSQDSLLEMRRKSALTVRNALLHGRYVNVVNRT